MDTLTAKTELLYLFGSKETQIMQVVHKQKFNVMGTVVLDHLMSSGNGSMPHDNFRTVKSSLFSKIEKPKFYSDISLKFFKDGRTLNGGLKNDSSFTMSNLSQDFMEVNLSNNSSSYSQFRYKQEVSVCIGQKLWFLPSIEYINEDRNYSGDGSTDSTFFSNVYYNENQFVDYYRWRQINGSIGVQMRDSVFQLSASLSTNNDYYTNRIKYNWQGFGVKIGVKRENRNSIFLSEGEYYFSGFRKGGIDGRIRTDFILDTVKKIAVYGSSSLLPPEINQIIYQGNHYKWNYNALQYPWHNSAGFSYQHSRLDFQFNISGTVTKDYYYFDTNMVASQVDKAHFGKVNVNKEFSLGRFRFPLKTSFNFWQSAEIRKPKINATGGVFVSLKIFKAKLKLDLGGQCNWHTKYFANRFEPSTGLTFLQNNQLIGNYPFIDLAVSSTIKRASFYFMALHVNENLTGRNYYTRPNYLEIGSRFLFGVKWSFVN